MTKATSEFLNQRLRTEEEARRQMRNPACRYCEGEPDPGWIEMPNNGPIVPCPVCNKEKADGPHN